MKTTNEIASRLISLCTAHQFVQAYTELFSEHAESIDPNYKNVPLKGLNGLIEREKAFLSIAEVHEVKTSAPIFAGSYFSIVMSLSFTPNGQERKSVEEICVYKVEYGLIVSQQFFIG